MSAHIQPLPFEMRSQIPLDPRTKLYLLLTVTTMMSVGSRAVGAHVLQPLVAFFPLLMLVLCRRFRKAAAFGVSYAVLHILDLTLRPHLSGVVGFLIGGTVGIYTFLLPGFVMGFYLIDTTSVSAFVAAMERMHLPQTVVIPVSVVFRFFPTLREEYAAIRDAMKMRGITLANPLAMLEYRVVPLLIVACKIGEELSAAALSRGLGAPVRRTNVCRVGFGWLDIAAIVLTLPCWLALILGVMA